MPEALVRYRPCTLVVAVVGAVDVVVAAPVDNFVVAAPVDVVVAAVDDAAVAGLRQRAETGSRRTPAGCAARWGLEAVQAGPVRRRRYS